MNIFVQFSCFGDIQGSDLWYNKMSGSVMDQLLFLKEYTDGLMAEMYSCFMLQPNMTASVDDALFFRTLDLAEYDKIRKQCNKMFSTFLVQPTNAQLQRTNHLEKLEGYDKLQANARNLAMFLSKYYQLLIAVMNFHAKILEILESFAQGMERLSVRQTKVNLIYIFTKQHFYLLTGCSTRNTL